MTPAAPPRTVIGGVVLDIEGTTTPASFVYEVLFPYARSRLSHFVQEHAGGGELHEVTRLLRDEWSADVAGGEVVPELNGPEHMAGYLAWLMDRDRKSPALKLIQGRIWERGYEDGTLRGEVYADVPPALERWHAAGRTIAIYSSGSVLAQRLLFAHSTAGDLTPFIDHYFDTRVGPKRSPDSYARIADAMGRRPDALLFISDVVAELDAARHAGFQVLLCDRSATDMAAIHSFDEIVGV